MENQKVTKENNNTEWISTDTISKEIIPASKSFIKKYIREICDIVEVGQRLFVEKAQLLAALRNVI